MTTTNNGAGGHTPAPESSTSILRIVFLVVGVLALPVFTVVAGIYGFAFGVLFLVAAMFARTS